ncbi:MAG TPA: hypothetical protein VJT73_12470 [Polyangiaceae bacterium]|nr:hypothetical protein [Polyangiaceae bacterium]
MKTLASPLFVGFLLAAPLAFGDVDGGPPSSAAQEAPSWGSCTEHVPTGASRPTLKEQFPAHATSGYAATLEVTLEHGKGETVLPHGFQVQFGSAEARSLADAGFVIPATDGGAAPAVVTTPAGAGATTKVTLPLLVLPTMPGRRSMTLPPLPIAVARASGELLTLCTVPHRVVVEDPTASTPDAKPHPNPPPRMQLEEWTLAKQIAIGALATVVLASALAALLVWWLRRPRPAPPPPPPRPPWEVAFEELFAVRHAGLVTQERFAEHYDRVSDAVRKYLGGRYGFDGLETTTREMTSILKRVEPPVAELVAILAFLDECDLVKFARFTPSPEDCARVLDGGEHIVHATIPQVAVPPRPAAGGAAR